MFVAKENDLKVDLLLKGIFFISSETILQFFDFEPLVTFFLGDKSKSVLPSLIFFGDSVPNQTNGISMQSKF